MAPKPNETLEETAARLGFEYDETTSGSSVVFVGPKGAAALKKQTPPPPTEEEA